MSYYEQIYSAYKKLKSNVYYDKTALILRDALVKYENGNQKELEKKLNEIIDKLLKAENKDNINEWDEYQKTILDSIEIIVLPKKIKKEKTDDTIIFNGNQNKSIEIEKYQYFLKFDVEGHILGALWILLIGKYLDKEVSDSAYGNRLREILYDDDNVDNGINLFKPYFFQYEHWRDKSLEIAKKTLKQDEDVAILTMDLKNFYYSVHYEKEEFDSFFEMHFKEDNLLEKRLNDFIYNVIKVYTYKLYSEVRDKDTLLIKKGIDIKDVRLLPIGFLPSNILANWRLNKFDRAIKEYINPLYYGRYVDDIIIVNKVDKESTIYKEKISQGICNKKDLIEYYFINCKATKNICDKNKSIFLEENNKDEIEYKINPIYIKEDYPSEIWLQNKKIKAFYFNSASTDALIRCFQKEIAKNISEFRYLPRIDSIVDESDFEKVFEIERTDSINKVHAIQNIDLNKYELSKFLSKYIWISSMTKSTDDLKEKEDSFFKVFKDDILIENYSLWEKLFEVLLIKERYDKYVELYKEIEKAIKKINENETRNWKIMGKDVLSCAKSLKSFLFSVIYRTLALSWGNKIDKLIDKIKDVEDEDFERIFSLGMLDQFRLLYYETRMVNKQLIPICVDFILEEQLIKPENENNLNLFDLENIMRFLPKENIDENISKYKYNPTIIQPQEIAFVFQCQKLKNDNSESLEKESSFDINYSDVAKIYMEVNYNNKKSSKFLTNIIRESDITNKLKVKDNGFKYKAICINTKKKDSLKIGIGNVTLKEKNFILVLENNRNRLYNRYKDLERLLREAIKNNIDLLVLPENYVPYEWLPVLTKFSAKNQIGIITGVEHFITNKNGDIPQAYDDCSRVHNLTAVILPYEDGKGGECNYSYLRLHEKTDLAPGEKQYIEGYGFSEATKNEVELFCWHNVWFPVFCCFELTSIQNRSVFQSYADMLVAIEWNKDVKYFSNIIESLSRDIHCYCIQVNSSNYGDSRIVQPTKADFMNKVRVKGGDNNIILVSSIDIKKLRDYQKKKYELQKDDRCFKPTPPRFDKTIVIKKINNTLQDELLKNEED